MSLRQIWTDASYVYAATSSGLDIIDIETEQRQSFVTSVNGYNTVWSSDTQVFVGTITGGIKVINKSDVGPPEMSSYTHDYESEPFLSNNNVLYIHGNETKLICCTAKGVDVLRRDSRFVSHTTISGAQKCFVTPNHHYYYTVSGTNEWYLHRLNDNSGNWLTSDVTYVTGSGFLTEATCLNDLYITEHTSISGVNNTLFVATDYGVHVYDEDSGDYSVFTTVSAVVSPERLEILAGSSNNFTSVWADPEANVKLAKLYVGSTGTGAAFSVVDLEHTLLIDSYTIDKEGSNDEKLEREDIVDINVSTTGA